MILYPVNLKTAKDFIDQYHRHNWSPQGAIFKIGLKKDDVLIGVIMVGRPICRHLDDGVTLEVNRTCINGYHKNACSMLLGAACRAGKNLGFEKIYTYTLFKESGSSLKGAGWINDKITEGTGSWSNREGRQFQLFEKTKKRRWVKILNKR